MIDLLQKVMNSNSNVSEAAPEKFSPFETKTSEDSSGEVAGGKKEEMGHAGAATSEGASGGGSSDASTDLMQSLAYRIAGQLTDYRSAASDGDVRVPACVSACARACNGLVERRCKSLREMASYCS